METHGVEVVTFNFDIQRESSSHQIFISKKGKTLRQALEPLCQSKGILVESVNVHLNTDPSTRLSLTYDLHSLAGRVVNIREFKKCDEPDAWYNRLKSPKLKRPSRELTLSPPTSPPFADSTTNVSGVNAIAQAAQSSTVSPFIVRKMYNTKPTGPLGGSTNNTGGVTRSTSGAAGMISARRPRPNDVPSGIGINKLLHLSEEYKNNSQPEEETSEHRHKKMSSSASLSIEETAGDVSPSGTLAKNQRQSTGKLGKAPASKERDKIEILNDLLNLWTEKGHPEMPPLLDIGLPKFDQSKFQIEEHWTKFIDKTGLTQRQKDQQEALWELLYTEVEYIRALYVIHDLFMCCLLNIQNDQVLNEMEVDKMFANITELAIINSDFWINDLIHVLEHSRKNHCLFNPSLLKPAFMSFEEKFKPYTEYCVSQGKCSEYVKKRYRENQAFRNFVLWAENQKQCNRLKLHDLLVKPMQRITRYSLLLRAIAKKTDEPEVKQDLQEMIDTVDKFVTEVDQTLRQKFEKEKLQAMAARIEVYEAVDTPLVDSECIKILTQNYITLDLMSPMPGCGRALRCVLMDGPLKLRDTSTKTDVQCILFTDMLLFCKPSKRDKLKIIKPPIKIDSIVIHEIKENPFLFLIHLTDFGVAQAAYTLHGENIGKWVKQFKKAQHQYMKAKEAARKEPNLFADDFESDDIGFAGPLSRDNSNPSDSAGIISMESDDENTTPPPSERNSSFCAVMPEEEKPLPRSATSPDIGRKHNTLPPNYKHYKDMPPQVKVSRNSSSDGSQLSVDSDAQGRRRIASSRRRDGGDRYLTADSIQSMTRADSNGNINPELQKRLSWSRDDIESSVDNGHPANGEPIFTLRGGNSQSSSSSSLTDETSNQLIRSRSREITPPAAMTKMTAALKETAVTDLRDGGDDIIRPATNSGRPPRKLSHLELVRMKKLLLTQGSAGAGVEI